MYFVYEWLKQEVCALFQAILVAKFNSFDRYTNQKRRRRRFFSQQKKKKNAQTKTPTITTVVMGKIQMSRFSSNQAMVSSQYYHCYFVFSLHVFQNIIVHHFRNGIFSEMMFTLSLFETNKMQADSGS